jgi:hypothetical protein
MTTNAIRISYTVVVEFLESFSIGSGLHSVDGEASDVRNLGISKNFGARSESKTDFSSSWDLVSPGCLSRATGRYFDRVDNTLLMTSIHNQESSDAITARNSTSVLSALMALAADTSGSFRTKSHLGSAVGGLICEVVVVELSISAGDDIS